MTVFYSGHLHFRPRSFSIFLRYFIHLIHGLEPFQIRLISNQHDLLKFSGVNILQAGDLLAIADTASDHRLHILFVILNCCCVLLFSEHIFSTTINFNCFCREPGSSFFTCLIDILCQRRNVIQPVSCPSDIRRGQKTALSVHTLSRL